MNKNEFAQHIANQHGCTKAEAERVINMFTTAVTTAFEKGDGVSLVGFGNFAISHVKARAGRNPRTGEPINIPAYNKPVFKAGATLKQACK